MLYKNVNGRCFRDVFLEIARSSLKRQISDGSMPSGCNGPHMDLETPVRNTSHFLMVYLKAWKISGDDVFYNAASNCLNWLLVDNKYKGAYTYIHRNKSGKDRCNGLIGSAWSIESLLYAYEVLNSSDALGMAKELFVLHPFDEKMGLWRRREVDGRILSLDLTFNHQLWFAASVAPILSEVEEVKLRIESFAENLKYNFGISTNGRIHHPVMRVKRRLREFVKKGISRDYRRKVFENEIGYQSFNLYAFAVLKKYFKGLDPVVEKRICRAVSYLNCCEYVKNIDNAKCGFGYNPPGWEVPFSKSMLLRADTHDAKLWIDRQLIHSYDCETMMLSKGTKDPQTHTARIYEAVRFPEEYFDIKIDLDGK